MMKNLIRWSLACTVLAVLLSVTMTQSLAQTTPSGLTWSELERVQAEARAFTADRQTATLTALAAAQKEALEYLSRTAPSSGEVQTAIDRLALERENLVRVHAQERTDLLETQSFERQDFVKFTTQRP